MQENRYRMKRRAVPWQPWAIFLGVLLVFLSGSFLSEGMGVPGLRNSVIAQTITEDYGDFWLPELSQKNPDMESYLPMGYWLQAFFMKIFGDSLLGDKLYSVLVFVLCGFLIDLIWHEIGNNKRTDWIPLTFWCMTPVIPKYATSNLLEGPLTVFVLLSIYFYILALLWGTPGKKFERHRTKVFDEEVLGVEYTLPRFLLTGVSALCSSIAFLIKGFSGLFVVFMPIAIWLFSPNRKNLRPFCDMIVMMGFWGIFAMIIAILSPGAHIAISNYFSHNLIGGLLTESNVSSHMHILFVLIGQMSLAVVCCSVLLVLLVKNMRIGTWLKYWKHRGEEFITHDDTRNMRFFWIFVTLGLCGVVPIMFGLKQYDFYLISVIPCFALACGCLVQAHVNYWMTKLSDVAVIAFSVLGIAILFLGVLLNLSSISKVAFDYELLTDMKSILPELQEGETVSCTEDVIEDEATVYYFYRYKRITLDTSEHHPHMIGMYNTAEEHAKYADYQRMGIYTNTYHLYQLRSLDTTASVPATPIKENSVDSLSAPSVRANSEALFPKEKETQPNEE